MSEDFNIHYKFWLEAVSESTDGRHGLGKGGIELLRAIRETGSLGRAAKKVGYSYKYAWNILRRIERLFGTEPVKAFRGGKGGGGGVELTDLGEKLIRYYDAFQSFLDATLHHSQQWKFRGLDQPPPNIVKGRVKSLKMDESAAVLKIELSSPLSLTSIITRDSKERLSLEEGTLVELLFKATAVPITKEDLF